MQVENDYDKDVYNGDLGVVSGIDMEEGELSVDLNRCLPMRPQSTRAKARNTQPS